MAAVKCNFIEMLVKGTGKTVDRISFDDYKLFVIWPQPQAAKAMPQLEKAVAADGCESAKGHLLLGEFEKPKVPRDGFSSMVEFGQLA